MNIDQEQLETWLAEVELVSQKVKELSKKEVNIKEFDQKEEQLKKKREQKKNNDEDKERQHRLEEYEKKKQGRSGKGNEKNYLNFCKACFWEYELPTPECLRCQKPTQTQEERYNYLLKKVSEYKSDKAKKEERKKKWELWKKTEAMLWKKNTTNYSKWDYYVSDSDSEKDDDPVLPKNDPNFKALEQDINQRAKKRNEDRIKAENLKEQANLFMKQQDYKKAVEKYTEALEIVKDMKCLWTNRALAYIKLQKFSKAIDDCTRVIDYCDCFEEGFTKSREFAYKAFFRRALAKKEKKTIYNLYKMWKKQLNYIQKITKSPIKY
ncbi:hypothetical protein IMG5_094970 [Ichthyophthirius multifiliis]|uniref:Tetratricopeptide repeat protein n=1 Tax=Ichthyophthirius multifiliis TaxID=5932 RepID=G0QRL1_ICHMU|nr:hypothetical protein IMG5_094970 [Ichthyophthirius multifiliis]EGR32132.1 hypothetical protein IMG5_094970 [Ichthyophthirius multifiliis]|eukprot:XP_004035618.1 hypothetical protein IMG5_094970 [Ichthyophthirius multifiliis]